MHGIFSLIYLSLSRPFHNIFIFILITGKSRKLHKRNLELVFSTLIIIQYQTNESRNRIYHILVSKVYKNKSKLSLSLHTLFLGCNFRAELYGTLIEMQLQTGVNYRLVKNVNELGSTLVNFVKAIADAPHK